MKRVLVSGTFDILHAGHIQFFKEARALGDHLTVCIPSDSVIRSWKDREPALSEAHRARVTSELACVDSVVVGSDNRQPELNFVRWLIQLNIDVLAVTDDNHELNVQKQMHCAGCGVELVILPKTAPDCEPLSTTVIRRKASLPARVPLRVDFAGGWLDVPKYADPAGYVVNCAITPDVSIDVWPYNKRAGLGGSAAWALLNGKDPVDSELDIAGWQDAAVIQQTGVCVWRSGERPVLDMQTNVDWLRGKMALIWSGKEHSTGDLLDHPRDYSAIVDASKIAMQAVLQQSLPTLAWAVRMSYRQQLLEGMEPVQPIGLARKYVGSGHGGYILVLFSTEESRNKFVESEDEAIAIEPYSKW